MIETGSLEYVAMHSAARRKAISTGTMAGMLIAPAVVLMGVFYVYPLLQVLWISFTDPSLGLDNYRSLAASASVRGVMLTTARVCITTTTITLLLGYVVALAITTGSARKRSLMLMLVVAPLWISALVRAFAWVVLLRREGVLNTLLMDMHVVSEPLQLVWNEVGVVIGMVHYMLPYAILPLYANMRDIDPRYVMAARGLGATRWKAFVKVFFPMAAPGVVGAGVLVFVYSLGFFVTPAILGGGKTLMTAEYIRLQIIELLQWGQGTALAVVLVTVVFVMLALVARFVGGKQIFGGTA